MSEICKLVLLFVTLQEKLFHDEYFTKQYIEIFFFFSAVKLKNFDFFYIFAQNIHCGYTLELPWPGGSNKYPQCMFWIKKIRYTPANPFFYIKVGYKGVYISQNVFLMRRFPTRSDTNQAIKDIQPQKMA